MSDHETTLLEMADRITHVIKQKASAYTGQVADGDLKLAASHAACLAGADALRREDTLRGIIESGIVCYKQNGGCSNCGGTPHTATCLVGQLELWLDAPTEPTR